MDNEFIELAERVILERGKEVLNDSRLTKALFLDHSKGSYKNEINLLIRTIDFGYPKIINESIDLYSTEVVLSRQLCEEFFINEAMAKSIIDLLIGLLQDKKYLTKINKNTTESTVTEINSIKNDRIDQEIKTTQNDVVKQSLKTWICGRCYTFNDDFLNHCQKCGKKISSKPIKVK